MLLPVYAAHCVNQGHQKEATRLVDTDVLVLALAECQSLLLHELCIAFGMKANLKYIPVHSIAQRPQDEKAKALQSY